MFFMIRFVVLFMLNSDAINVNKEFGFLTHKPHALIDPFESGVV